MKIYQLFILLLLFGSLHSQNISEGEYFIDNDPGIGSGVPILGFIASDSVDLNLNVSTAGLTPGIHRLYIRFKDLNGTWGIYQSKSFYVQAPNPTLVAATNLTKAEYFFDTDPGIGNGTAITNFTPSDTVDLNLNLSHSGLSVGNHRVFVRFKDADGKWGIYQGGDFSILNCSSPIVAVNQSTTYGCVGELITFSDNSTNVGSSPIFEWDINNDGTYDSVQTSISLIANIAGNYVINYRVTNGQCKDSIRVNYTIEPTYNLSQTATICPGDSYTFPDGTTQNNITSTVNYNSNLQTTSGCDSIISTTVSLNSVYNLSQSATICPGDSYTFPDGTTQNNITSTVNYTSNLQTASGCDSIISTTVSLNPVYNLSQSATICPGDSYTFPDGTTQNNITSTVNYTSNLQTASGCDSIISTTVSLNPVYNLSQSATICPGDSYTFPDGTTQNNITSTVNYTSNLQTASGCDSIITTTLNPVLIDTSLTVSGLNISSNQSNANYQWLQCTSSGYTSISGETNASFTASSNGNYALEIRIGNCKDTTRCIPIISVGINDNKKDKISIFPNPTNGYIELIGIEKDNYQLRLFNQKGMLIQSMKVTNHSVDISHLAKGVYIAEVTLEGNIIRKKIIKL